MPTFAILADDLTGACDTGVAFARRGWSTRVCFSPQADFSGAAVRVLANETRSLSEEQAVQVIEHAVHTLGLGENSLVYQKIDSTLRGHPGVELAAVMRAAKMERALIAPAFPSQGRLVKNGRVWVRGVRLEETEFAADVPQPDMQRLFATAGEPKILQIQDIHQGVERVAEILRQPGVYIADAGSEADLSILALAARRAGIRLFCGSAGLARALAETLPIRDKPLAYVQTNQPVVLVSGSRSPVTLQQVEAAGQAGIKVLSLKDEHLRVANQQGAVRLSEKGAIDQICAASAALLIKGENLIITFRGSTLLPGAASEIAAALSIVTADILVSAPVGGLVLTGGDTAAAVFHALHCSAFELGGEVQPGVVWGRLADGPYAGLAVITKAGGFGDSDTLVRAVRFLRFP